MLLLLLIRGISASMDCETMMRNGSNAKTPLKSLSLGRALFCNKFNACKAVAC